MFARVWATSALGLLAIGAAWPMRAQHSASTQPAATAHTPPINFDHDIRPILADHCWKCHADRKQKNNLRLDSRDAVLHGGDSGPAAIPGKSADSLLIHLVSGKDP